MKDTAKLYYYYHNPLTQVVKLLVVFLLLGWTVSVTLGGHLPNIPLFFLSLLLMWETFFHFGIAKTKPQQPVAKSASDIYASFTLQALHLLSAKDITVFLPGLLHQKPVLTLLEKADMDKKEVKLITIANGDLAKHAFEVAKTVQATFVTSLDVFAAYLLLTEKKTQLLFQKELKEHDLLNILYWVRHTYHEEEQPVSHLARFWGEGIGDAMVSGWTIETKKYTIDITPEVMKQKSLLIGRDIEYKAIIESLVKANKNSLLLVGEVGSGKQALVYTLAYESFLGNLGSLSHKKVYELLVDALIAGVTDQGDLEVRLRAIIEEVGHARNVLLYIPSIENIAGASTFKLNLSGALLPYLESGNIQLIATATPGNFKTYIEPNKALLEAFAVVKLQEPEQNVAIQMLLYNAQLIEEIYQVYISYQAVVAAATLAKRYIHDTVLPGAAVQLLDDAANSVSLAKDSQVVNGRKIVTAQAIEAKVTQTTGVATSKPNASEKQLLLHLEDKLHEKIIGQDEAVSVISEALRRLRVGLTSQTKPVTFLFLGPTGVGKTETAKTLSDVYYQGQYNMIRLDMSEYSSDDGKKRLLGAPPGEGDEQGELTEKVKEHPFSLVLLDEFEKAHPDILNLFLQVFDDGRLTDNKGKTVSFADCMMIATSNAGAEIIREAVNNKTPLDAKFQQQLLEQLQKSGMFKPELLNRFDAIVMFKPLSDTDMLQVAKLMLLDVIKTMHDKDITLSVDQKVLAKLIKEGIDPEFGARPLRRFIQDKIDDVLAKEMLSDKINRGNKVKLTTNEKNNITAEVS